MSILVMCSNPGCGELFDAPDEATGRRVQCPICGTIQIVAKQAHPASSAGPAQPAAADQAEPNKKTPPEAELPTSGSQGQDETLSQKLLQLGDIDSSSDSARQGAVGAANPPGKDEIDLRPADYELVGAGDPQPSQEILDAPIEEADEAPAEPKAGFSDVFDEALSVADSESAEPAGTTDTGYEGVLKHKPVAGIVFAIGLLGMALGLIAGLSWAGSHPILAGYGGAALGWVAGFIFAFFIIWGAERAEGGKVQCPLCRNVFPFGTQTCNWCGTSLAGLSPHPLTAHCLKAGSYAASNITSVYWLAILVAAGVLLFAGVFHLLRVFPSILEPWRLAMIGFCAIVGFIIFACWLQFLLSCIGQTLLGCDKVPDVPRLCAGKNILTGIKALAVLAVYVLPLFTMPLLPLGLLSMGSAGRRSAFDLVGSVRLVRRHAKDFAVLWLLLLVWSSGAVLAIAVAMLLLHWLAALIPPMEGASGTVLSLVSSTVAAAILGAISCLFGLATFRCIGLFGRYSTAGLSCPPTATNSPKPAISGAEG